MKRPETDLHLHLDGSLSIDAVKTLADRIEYDFKGKDVKKMLSVGENCESLPDYLKCFDLPGILLQTKEALEYAACDLVKRLAGQGLVYAEIRFAPQLHKQKGLTQGQAVEAVVKGVRAGCLETGIYAGVLLCAMVNGSDAENAETMELAKVFFGEKTVNGVIGADIAGPEGFVPMEHFEGMFKRVYQAGVPFTIHAGECGDYENVARAVAFGAKRIGHGCAAIQSEDCMRLLEREKITLEMCVVSNLQTKAVAGIKEHPLKKFFDRGIRVTYNTDNMTVSDTSLEREAELIMSELGFREEELKKMNEYAIDGAFVGEEVKCRIRELMRK
ncbi:adenosine deaminase [Hungatella sp. SB206]|uniref:adenosine deaminase n=1 Tax=Hungatella sp. SB206 TaxID=2937758 RepID=UPI003DA7EA23